MISKNRIKTWKSTLWPGIWGIERRNLLAISLRMLPIMISSRFVVKNVLCQLQNLSNKYPATWEKISIPFQVATCGQWDWFCLPNGFTSHIYQMSWYQSNQNLNFFGPRNSLFNLRIHFLGIVYGYYFLMVLFIFVFFFYYLFFYMLFFGSRLWLYFLLFSVFLFIFVFIFIIYFFICWIKNCSSIITFQLELVV